MEEYSLEINSVADECQPFKQIKSKRGCESYLTAPVSI